MRPDVTAPIIAAAASSTIRTAHLFKAVFTNSESGVDETYYLTDWHRDVVAFSQTWQGLGQLLGFSGLGEDTDLQINRVSVSLSGIDPGLLSAVLQYRFIDRQLEIYRVFFDAAGVLIDNPVKIFDGRMDEPVIAEDPSAQTVTVSLSAANLFVNFTSRAGRHTNNEEQQAFFLGDRGFEFVGKLDKDLTWGSK